VPLKKAENPQESYKMDEREKNSFGLGVIVGVITFFVLWSGFPLYGTEMDLIGSLGIGFGSGFSASIVSYMMSRDE